jgi:hypothetical protein
MNGKEKSVGSVQRPCGGGETIKMSCLSVMKISFMHTKQKWHTTDLT